MTRSEIYTYRLNGLVKSSEQNPLHSDSCYDNVQTFPTTNSLILSKKILISWINRLFAVTLFFILSSIVTWGIFCPSATALLRQHHETANVLRYHAQDSLKDRDGNTWQVILFPDNSQSQNTTYYLRLVGFPGVNSFNHPQSLEILTSAGQIFTASDAYAQSAPATNVGQYDLTAIMSQLANKQTGKQSLKLSTPLQDNKELGLKISPAVFAEWQLLTQEIEAEFS